MQEGGFPQSRGKHSGSEGKLNYKYSSKIFPPSQRQAPRNQGCIWPASRHQKPHRPGVCRPASRLARCSADVLGFSINTFREGPALDRASRRSSRHPGLWVPEPSCSLPRHRPLGVQAPRQHTRAHGPWAGRRGMTCPLSLTQPVGPEPRSAPAWP